MLVTKAPSKELPPRAVMLNGDVALVAFRADNPIIAWNLTGAEPPYGTVDVTSSFGLSKIAATRLPAQLLAGDSVDPTEDFAPMILGSDVVEFAKELDQPSRRRLLAFMLGFCRKAFGLGDDPDFANAALRMARFSAVTANVTEPVGLVTPTWTLLANIAIEANAPLFRLNDKCVQRTAIYPIRCPYELGAIERVASGDVILALHDEPVIWTVATARSQLRDLLNAPPEDALRVAALQTLAPVSPVVRTRAREIALLAPAAPVKHNDPRLPVGAALEAAFPGIEGQIFLRGWLRDPMRLVTSAELRGPIGATAIPLDTLHRFRRPDLAKHFGDANCSDADPRLGFVAYVADPGGGLSLQPSLIFHLRGGARVVVRPPLRSVEPAVARNAILASVPGDDVNEWALENALGPAAASFHRQSLANRGRPDLLRIGPQPSRPRASLIIPLYRTLTFLRFQVAALAADPTLHGIEIIFVLDSPEQRYEVEHLLRGLYRIYEIPMTLLVLTRNLGYAAANNAAAEHASAPVLLLLNSDVIPATSGWLATMLDALEQRGVGAVGPKLLFEDESLQHAGLMFRLAEDGVWLNAHYYKGMPRRWTAALRRRNVPGVTGAALLVRHNLFERVGGVCEDYIIGDYEDSDFCLRLRAIGEELVYVPEAELFHFERRSISQHTGYVGTLASLYNRRLHHQRWNAAIEDLMHRSDFCSPSMGRNA